jgi:hypothetical protein
MMIIINTLRIFRVLASFLFKARSFTRFNLLLLLLIAAGRLQAQKPFSTNSKGEVTDGSMHKLIKEREYQAVSAFDTVSKKPLLVYAIYFKNGRQGILDINGREVTRPIYDELDGLNRNVFAAMFGFHENYTVKSGKKYGMIDAKGKVIIPANYDYIRYSETKNNFPYASYGRFHDSLYEADQGDAILIFNKAGRLVSRKETVEQEEPGSRYEGDPDMQPFQPKENTQVPGMGNLIRNNDGMGIVEAKANGRYYQGAVNLNTGKEVLPAIYDYIYMASGKKFIASKEKKCQLFDSSGNDILGRKYDLIESFNSVFKITDDKKMALFSTNLANLTGFVYDNNTGYANADIMVMYKNGKAGIVSLDGKEKTSFIYEEIKFYSDFKNFKIPLVLVTVNGLKGYINTEGRPLTGFEYEMLIPECRVESDGNNLEEPIFGFESNTINQFHFYKKEGKYGLLDTAFQPLVPNEYDYMKKSGYSDLVYVARKEGNALKWGVLDIKKNQLLIPMEYESDLKCRSGRFITVKKGQSVGIFNEEGKMVVPLEAGSRIYMDYIFKGLIKVSGTSTSSFYLDYMGNRVALPVAHN